jgi:hypothetical protein
MAAMPVPLPAGCATGRAGALRIAAWVGAVACMIAVAADPVLANKFETIGSGVSGSTTSKREWLRMMLFVGAGLGVLGSLAAVFMPRRNAHYLNYSNWKVSSAVLAIMSLALAIMGFVV